MVKYGENLTDGQDQAMELLDKFYNSSQKEFVLKGAAGTGKTHIINNYLQYVNKRPVAVTAPTHKAVRVIERATHRTGYTIQHIHGLRPNFNISSFDIDKVVFDTIGDHKFGNYYTIIVDESSMISSPMYDLNKLRSTQNNCKLIYIGDPYQLPPVSNERQSIVFSLDAGYELTEVVRQTDGNALRTLLPILRGDVINQTSHFLDEIQRKPIDIDSNGFGYEALSPLKFIDSLNNSFSHLHDNLNNCRMLCWTNPAVWTWNKYIRNKLLNTPAHILIEDDLLTSYQTIVDDYFQPIIVNSDDYIIVELAERESEWGFGGYRVVLKSLEDSRISTVFMADHSGKNWMQYYNRLNDLHIDAIDASPSDRRKAFKSYYNFKNQNLSLVKFPLVDDVSELIKFLNNFRKTGPQYQNVPDAELMQFYDEKDNIRAWVDKDMDYGFASTVHKAQGSTYKESFVNLLDIFYYRSDVRNPVRNTKLFPYAKEMRNKLTYTAVSRAREKAVILVP
jgi:exodeoxyribonuclease-5